jgi:hypothetical protein
MSGIGEFDTRPCELPPDFFLEERIVLATYASGPNASVPDFLPGYDRTTVIYATVGMAPEGPGSQCVWSVVVVQERRRMIQTYREQDDMTYEQLYSEGSIKPLRLTFRIRVRIIVWIRKSLFPLAIGRPRPAVAESERAMLQRNVFLLRGRRVGTPTLIWRLLSSVLRPRFRASSIRGLFASVSRWVLDELGRTCGFGRAYVVYGEWP